jgi:polyphosphate kinase 2 (PPK2 family)
VNYLERFRVAPGSRVRLKDVDPAFKDRHESHQDAAEEIEHYRRKLLGLQDVLYAERRRSLLICLQAMDTGGKDGTINHVLGAMNPQGCRVAPFRQPAENAGSAT